MHYAYFTLTLRTRHELLTRLSTTILGRYLQNKDTLWIEIPIERPDKAIHSEILIVSKKIIKEFFKQQPHIEKALVNITPNNMAWPKDMPLQILGENQESVDQLIGPNRISDFILN